jgi:hypothetical protein
MMLEAVARVEALLAIARRIADREDALGREARTRLREISRLSMQGIDLALAEHLETRASPAELERLVAWEPPAASCAISLAGNVCTAALRAIALGLAAAPRVHVRPSRRDPVLAEILVREATALGLEVALEGSLPPAEVLHLYGSDQTLEAMPLPPHRRAYRFGSGFGVACCSEVDRTEDVARDLVVFDGAGCLSPRLVVAPCARAETIARALHEALSGWGKRVPRGPLESSDRAALRRAAATHTAVGEIFEGPHHAVAFDPAPRALSLLPPLRATLVVASDDPAALLSSRRDAITCVGGACDGHFGGARRAALGMMQRPPLDGPVDLR